MYHFVPANTMRGVDLPQRRRLPPRRRPEPEHRRPADPDAEVGAAGGGHQLRVGRPAAVLRVELRQQHGPLGAWRSPDPRAEHGGGRGGGGLLLLLRRSRRSRRWSCWS